ncbi:MAG: tetraacyldisaccharide 4'-kinase [Acidiferrobacterales bacterium]|nr:tetraacyldisaccharide 4'-kinase [Acidiferrobacterales bacterium]
MIQQIQQGWQQPGWLNYLVLPISWLYAGLVWVRQWLYRMGMIPAKKPSVPVVVVGNITVGGSGKTPLVISLANHLRRQGWNPGLIARGYGGQSATWPRLVTDTETPNEVGDEPVLLYQSTGLPVVAGPHRLESIALLVDQCRCNVVISDDGYQHFALIRDLDLVVVDADRQFGNGWCLPAGPLREPLSGLSRAGLVVLNGEVREQMTAVKQTASEAGYTGKVFSSVVKPAGVYRLKNVNEKKDLSQFSGTQIHAVAGLGNPDRFSRLLSEHEISHTPHFFPDHHAYCDADFLFLQKNDVVIMTEKDAVKCTHLSMPDQTWVLQIEAVLQPDCLQAIEVIVGRSVEAQGYTGAA